MLLIWPFFFFLFKIKRSKYLFHSGLKREGRRKHVLRNEMFLRWIASVFFFVCSVLLRRLQWGGWEEALCLHLPDPGQGETLRQEQELLLLVKQPKVQKSIRKSRFWSTRWENRQKTRNLQHKCVGVGREQMQS